MVDSEEPSRPAPSMARIESRGLVLLVDDDKAFVQRLGKALQVRHFDIEICDAVSTAIEALQRRHFDVVITDLRIGERSGLDVVEKVRQLDGETKTLVLTGFGSVQTAVSAVKLGATEFLSKPADADEILEVLGMNDGIPSSAREAFKPAEVVRWDYVTGIFKETGYNMSASARLLNMHRRTLQRMLLRGRPTK